MLLCEFSVGDLYSDFFLLCLFNTYTALNLLQYVCVLLRNGLPFPKNFEFLKVLKFLSFQLRALATSLQYFKSS